MPMLERYQTWKAAHFPIAIWEAAIYPLRWRNLVAVTLVPALAQYVAAGLMLLVDLSAAMALWQEHILAPGVLKDIDWGSYDWSQVDPNDFVSWERLNWEALALEGNRLFSGAYHLPLELGLTALLSGFYWYLTAAIQREGVQAPAPAWSRNGPGFLWHGAKLAVYYSLITLPFWTVTRLAGNLFLEVISLGPLLGTLGSLILSLGILLAPFLLANPVAEAQAKGFWPLFNMRQAWRLGKAAYWRVLGCVGVALMVALLEATLFFTLTCCLAALLMPVFTSVVLATSCHLVAQGFAPPPEASEIETATSPTPSAPG